MNWVRSLTDLRKGRDVIIPDYQFPHYQLPIPFLIVTQIAMTSVADHTLAFFPSLEYIYNPKIARQDLPPRCIHKSHLKLIKGVGGCLQKGNWVKVMGWSRTSRRQ
jgi:hypothetical protein